MTAPRWGSLAAAIQGIVENHFAAALAQDTSARVQVVLAGPPGEALAMLFGRLTSDGSRDMTLTLQPGGGQESIPVILVGAPAPVAPQPGSRSCRATWDHAVTARNSYPRLLILAGPSACNSVPESLVNATEAIGSFPVATAAGFAEETVLWPALVDAIASNLGLEDQVVTAAMRGLLEASQGILSTERLDVAWQVIDRLLDPELGDLESADMLAAVVGLPRISDDELRLQDIRAAHDVLVRLAEFLEGKGLENGLAILRATTTGHQVETQLASLHEHFLAHDISVAALARACRWYYRPSLPPPDWWHVLDHETLGRLLDEVGAPSPTGTVRLTLPGSMNGPYKAKDEPWIFRDQVQLAIEDPSRTGLVGIAVTRKIIGGGSTPLQVVPGQDGTTATCSDSVNVRHEKPIAYRVHGPNIKPAVARVVVLECFAPRGIVCLRTAIKNPGPEKQAGRWVQDIIVGRPGVHDLVVHVASSVSSVEVIPRSGGATVRASGSPARFSLPIDEDQDFELRLLDPGNAVIGGWDLHVTIAEPEEDAPTTLYEALIKAHQEPRRELRTPKPGSLALRQIEDQYLESGESWKPVLAGFSRADLAPGKIDWANPCLGDIHPQADPRPSVQNPPASLLSAREILRANIRERSQLVCEADLSGEEVTNAITNYLQAYSGWLASDPDRAPWFDCIAVHGPVPNPQAGGTTATVEPLAILLSPLHPLRLAWQCLAQRLLAGSLDSRCPAAGLLSPHAVPDAGSWTLHRADTPPVSRGFFALAPRDPYWGLLWNREYLDEREQSVQVLDWLAYAGLGASAVSGGFTRAQAHKAIDEISKIFAARGTLRCGVVGIPTGNSSAVWGLVDWCREHYSAGDAQPSPYPFSVEVHDGRPVREEPSPELLANLAEETEGKIRWFRKRDGSLGLGLDLVILDQLKADNPRGAQALAHSAAGPGGLTRIRVREDFDGARYLRETRIGTFPRSGIGLGLILGQTLGVFEARVSADSSVTALEYVPNQQAIGNRLGQSRLVAVTSSQVDPACFTRSVETQGGYLWDYELPGTLGVDEDKAGYYLVAKPLESMKRAIGEAMRLVTGVQPEPRSIEELLAEVSRRGIPILKRLSNRGTHSRGELGALLAVRYLQDAFGQGRPRTGLPAWDGNNIHMLLPVDPYEDTFFNVQKGFDPSSQGFPRPDLLAYCIRVRGEDDPVEIKITPIEVKFRNLPLSPAELERALNQATSFGTFLKRLWADGHSSELWNTCAAALLGECLDHAFRVYADPRIHGRTTPEWTMVHERTLRDVLSRRARIQVNETGCVLGFDTLDQSRMMDTDGDGRSETVVLSRQEAAALLGNAGPVEPDTQRWLWQLGISLGPEPPPQGATGGETPQQPREPAGPAPAMPAPAEPQPPAQPAPRQAGGTASTEPAPEAAAGAPRVSPVPREVRERVDHEFTGFIGNQEAVANLRRDVLSALIEQPVHLAKNYLFTGQPSTGKTSLAKRLADALALPFIRLDGRSVASRDRLFEVIDRALLSLGFRPAAAGREGGQAVFEYPAFVLFVDEVHLMPLPVQESFLTMLESADRSVSLGGHKLARVRLATFLFATTRASEVDAAFRSRCSEINLRDYTVQEVAQIVESRFPGWPATVYQRLATLGRQVPRIALELATSLQTEIRVSEHQERSPEQHLAEVARTRTIDDLGLTDLDRQYLELLAREARPLGERPILNMLRNVDRERILNEVEPYVIQVLGFAKLGPSGREITPRGRQYLQGRRGR